MKDGVAAATVACTVLRQFRHHAHGDTSQVIEFPKAHEIIKSDFSFFGGLHRYSGRVLIDPKPGL